MPRKKTATRIEDDTPIIPFAVAEMVINEVDRCVPLDMSQSEMDVLANKLADHADTIYARNESFRRKIRGRGDTGRDALYAFMRHWLSSELKKSRPHVFSQLPQTFMVGEELDCGRLRPAHRTSHATQKKSPAQLQREIDEALTQGGGTGTYPFSTIQRGCRVTIVTPQYQHRTGTAVMRGPHGWVLNMGGKHGTPGIATEANVIMVRCPSPMMKRR